MAYHELIKNFDGIRAYMRAFYVYGFKSRTEYSEKSARSYDNERRRMDSWLGACMSFHQEASGKCVFLSVDSRRIAHNPLFQAFKAKSFTDRDITLHFYLLDLLADGSALSATEVVERIAANYLSRFEGAEEPDESTVRKKLKEYEALGLLESEKRGREKYYRRTDREHPDLATWADALAFFAEENPLGVVGSYLQDKLGDLPTFFRFKHHYMLHVLDSEVLCALLLAIGEKREVAVSGRPRGSGQPFRRRVCPLKIYVSTQTGRQYVLCYEPRERSGRMQFYRLDTLTAVEPGAPDAAHEAHAALATVFERTLWGVSTGTRRKKEHVEMEVRVEPDEAYIVRRLEREKRHGTVEKVRDGLYRFRAEVFDAIELLPWIRTFTGRITALRSDNELLTRTFRDDLNELLAMYGEGGDDLQ